MVDVLNQFDFTANAIAMDLSNQEFLDPHDGIADIRNRIMRAVRFDFPDTPILPGSEITWRATRWFRIIHYANTLDLTIEPTTLKWLQSNTHYLAMRGAFAEFFFDPNLGLFGANRIDRQ